MSPVAADIAARRQAYVEKLEVTCETRGRSLQALLDALDGQYPRGPDTMPPAIRAAYLQAMKANAPQ